jgi:hypothetical protein
MTSQYSDAAGAAAWADGHASDELLARYAAGTVATVVVWSVEAHLGECARCRSALSVHVDGERLARNRSVLLVRAATPDGPAQRLLCRCGVPEYLLRLLAVTPSLRLSWLLSVIGALAVVAGEAAAVRYGWLPGGHPAVPAGSAEPLVLATFLLVAPLLVLAGVAAAFLPAFDPAYLLAVAAPLSGFALLLARAVCALATALIPATVAALVVPGPGWLPAGLLLPSLALCAFALAAATVTGPRVAAVTAGALWATPALLLATAHLPLLIVQRNAQFACAAVLLISVLVMSLRHDRFELGWMR